MAGRRTFHVEPPDEELEPFEFELVVQRRKGEEGSEDEAWVEESHAFTTYAEVPAGPLLRYAERAALTGRWPLAQLVAFVESSLPPADRLRFRQLVLDDDVRITSGVIGDVAKWLAQELYGRPTRPSTGSPDGRGNDGTTSEPGSSSPESEPGD